jgi:transcriptional regulator with PAS, ATPase and Fis domain
LGSVLALRDLGGTNGTFIYDRSLPRGADDTLDARQLRDASTELAIGDSFVLGTASAVVRRAAKMELPDLNALIPAGTPNVVVSDERMRTLHEQAARAAKASISVLLLGETGVGKEVLARAIHAHSARRDGPFIGINCGALAESLLESELFGSERGAFTGAGQARVGLFEAADRGTVFLDEVGELPLGTQVKLLRVLEERAVTRVGGTRSRPIDLRVIAATNRDIEGDARLGRFRQDLFFRLNGMTLVIPPLRERPGDLVLLIRSLLLAACQQLERPEPLAISSRAFELLREYEWPGNVRELRNAMERAAVLCPGNTILPEHLPPAVQRKSSSTASREGASVAGGVSRQRDAARVAALDAPGPRKRKAIGRDEIAEALRLCGGNQSRAAEQLGISRRTLVSRVRTLKLPRPRKQD